MRAKLANLEFLRTKQPHVQMVNTWNAAINDHMVDINEAIGFRAVERWREWQLELSRPTSQLHDFSRVGVVGRRRIGGRMVRSIGRSRRV